MKTRPFVRRKSAKIRAARWSAYATAGAATAVSSATSAEGNTITYSGLLNRHFGAVQLASYFQLDQPGHSLIASRFSQGHIPPFGGAVFGFRDPYIVSGALAGFYAYNFILSKLSFGQNISARPFGRGEAGLAIYNGAPSYLSPWLQRGTGFVGFRFDSGAGQQYGWARITMDSGAPANTFTLVDYAFADPGQPISAGQIPDAGGSLGLLALGCAGLLAWRARRSNAVKTGVW
jgi:hypothetical protein